MKTSNSSNIWYLKQLTGKVSIKNSWSFPKDAQAFLLLLLIGASRPYMFIGL